MLDQSFSEINSSDLQHSSSGSTNEDLKELCHLLNEERETMFQLTARWKETSTSTIHKLEEQIDTYQKKLFELEQRQNHLIEENHFLKNQLEQTKKPKRKDSKKKLQSPPPLSPREELPSSLVVDSLEQQTTIQRMFDAIRTAEVYESLENFNVSEKIFLREFCHMIWKYLQERSKPKSSCLL